jgi:hypothetical protein
MQVSMRRKLKIAQFEMIELEVTIDDDEVPDGDKKIERMQRKAYSQILAFEVFNGYRTADNARSEARRFNDAYGLVKSRVSNGAGSPSSSAPEADADVPGTASGQS